MILRKLFFRMLFMDGEDAGGGIGLAEVIGDAGGSGGDGGGAAGGGGDSSGKEGDQGGAGGAGGAGDGRGGDAAGDRGQEADAGERKGKEDADAGQEREDKAGKERDDKGEEEEVTGSDGRKITDGNLRRGIAALRKTDKAAGKAVADAYFANQDVIKATGAQNVRQAVSQVRAMKATIDSLGGDQGIADLQTEVSDWREEGAQFVAGDMRLIEKLAEADPNALHLTSANALEWLGINKPELFDKTILPPMMAKLDSVGFDQVLDNVAALLEKGKGQEAYDLLHRMRLWSKDMHGKAEKMRGDRAESAKKNPKDEEYARKDAEYAKRDEELFGKDTNRTLTRLNNSILDDQTRDLFKELGLDNEGKRDFIQGLMGRIWAKIERDKSFQSSAKAVRAKKDPNELAEFIHAKFAELLPDEFIAYRNVRYPSASRSKKAASGAGSGGDRNANSNNGKGGGGGNDRGAAAAAGSGKTPETAIMLRDGEMPTKAQVDWKDPNAQLNYISGRAKLINGKYVRWRVRHN